MYLQLVTLAATSVGQEANGALVWTVRCGDDAAGSLQRIEKKKGCGEEADVCSAGKKPNSKRNEKILILQQRRG